MKYIVIHGHHNYGYHLSPDSVARCNTALKIRTDETIICSGGLFFPDQEGITVSKAMSHYLGIDCIQENKSITSIENVEEIIKMINITDELLVVSSWYHIPRLWLIWKLIGKRKVKLVPAPAYIPFSRLFLELLGMYTALLYWLGLPKRELLFRKKRAII